MLTFCLCVRVLRFDVTVATVPPPLERMQSIAKLPEDVGFLDAKAREAAATKARLELAAEIKRKRLQTAKNRVFAMVAVVAVFFMVALANGHYSAAK
jgi:hypothetical protein